MVCSVAVAWSGQATQQGDPAKGKDQASEEKQTIERERAERLELMKKAAADYEIYLGSDRTKKLNLRPEPILRWANPVRDTVDAASFLWVSDGRPQVVACVYLCRVNEGQLAYHEFQSLSRSPLSAERDGQTVWHPSQAGAELKPVPDAPAPAREASLRLAQMRTLAREFSASITAPESAWELRLLPQPLYRYDSKDAELLDGGLFVFAQGTDPEVVLLLEARRPDSGYSWQYAIARMCAWALQAEHKGQAVWTVPTIRQHDPKEPYFMFRDKVRQ